MQWTVPITFTSRCSRKTSASRWSGSTGTYVPAFRSATSISPISPGDLVHPRPVGDVAGERLARQLGELVGRTRGEEERVPAARELPRGRGADPGRRPGDPDPHRAEHELDVADRPRAERRLAVREVELPRPDEALVVAEPAHVVEPRHEALAPGLAASARSPGRCRATAARLQRRSPAHRPLERRDRREQRAREDVAPASSPRGGGSARSRSSGHRDHLDARAGRRVPSSAVDRPEVHRVARVWPIASSISIDTIFVNCPSESGSPAGSRSVRPAPRRAARSREQVLPLGERQPGDARAVLVRRQQARSFPSRSRSRAPGRPARARAARRSRWSFRSLRLARACRPAPRSRTSTSSSRRGRAR